MNLLNEHISDNLLNRYRAGKLSLAELLQFDAHLQVCDACQNHLAKNKQVAESFAALKIDLSETMAQPSAHLSYEELAGYLDSELNLLEVGRVEAHLQGCNSCALEVEDLRAFQLELNASKTVAPQSKSSWLMEWWQSLSWRWTVPLAAAACLLIAWFGMRLLRSANNDAILQPEFAQNPVVTPSPQIVNPAESLLASINDGTSRVTLDELGNLKGLALTPAHQQLVIAALKNGKVSVASSGLAKQAETLLGDSTAGQSFALISPVGKIELSQRPQFRWQALPGAIGYRVIIFTADYETVAQSESLSVTNWTPPRSLARNQTYVWQVVAFKDGQEIKAPVAPAAEARFKILDQTKANEITAARGSSLLSALLYAQAGLTEEAERELQKLAKENPQSTIVRQLLESLRAQRKTVKP